MLDVTPMLNKQSKVPLYLQLYDYMKGEIEAGNIKDGAQLPSIRQLSSYLKISKNTVETAYQQLIAEGYVESKNRSGLYVLALEEITSIGAFNFMKGSSEKPHRDCIHEHNPIQFDFHYGDIDEVHFHTKIWMKCIKESLYSDPHEVLGYGHPQGDYELREEMVKYLFQSRGVRCSPNQIFICSGTQQSISLLCQLLPLTGKRVAMEEPGYSGVRAVLRNHGCEIVSIPLDTDGLQIEQLIHAAAGAVYVTPSHQFPMGMVLPISKRNGLLQWAYENKGLIIEDDYDSEFRYIGQPIPALKALDHGEKVIYLGTFSKSFLPSARLSYMVLPETLADSFRLNLRKYKYNQSASPLIQKAMMLFMRKGHFERHVRKMRRLYQAKHKTLLETIHKYMKNRVEIIGQKAGLHILLNVRNRERSELIEQAYKVGIKVYSPEDHWANAEQCPPSFIMLGFGGMNEAAIGEGVRRLAQAWFVGMK